MTRALQPLQPIRERLAERVSALQAIEGAAELAAAMKAGLTRTPTAFVVMSSTESSKPQGASGVLVQTGVVEVSIVLGIRNYRVHEHGAESAEALEGLIESVQDALLRWRPDEEHEFYHVRGQLMEYDAGVLFWREDFARNYRIRKT